MKRQVLSKMATVAVLYNCSMHIHLQWTSCAASTSGHASLAHKWLSIPASPAFHGLPCPASACCRMQNTTAKDFAHDHNLVQASFHHTAESQQYISRIQTGSTRRARANCAQFHGDMGRASGSSRLSMEASSTMTMGLLAVGVAGARTNTTVKTEKGAKRNSIFSPLTLVALLDQVDVPAAKPARLDDAQRRRHTRG